MSRVPNTPVNVNVPVQGVNSFSNYYGSANRLAAGVNLYTENGNLTVGNVTNDYVEVYKFQTTFDYQESGNILNISTLFTGSIAGEMKIDPTDHFGRANNSGDDRYITVTQITGTGSAINVTRDDTVISGQPGPTGWASNTACFFFTIANVEPGDIFRIYMYNGADWRDNQGYEQIEDLILTSS